MDRASWIFCTAALMASVAIAAIAYPFAAMPTDQYAMASEPQPAETLGLVDVGNGFGSVPVTELMDYYIANPPAKASAGPAAAPVIKFGGC